MEPLRLGSSGQRVSRLQRQLKKLGFNPGALDGDFGPATHAAVIGFQQSEGLLADGVAGPRTLKELGLARSGELASCIGEVTPRIVSEMFPYTPVDHIKTNLPYVLEALDQADLVDKTMVSMALATIRAETESFQALSEGLSKFNTSPGGHPFDLYDRRRDLGNQGAPDGERFRGRGFVQLTGRANYERYGQILSLGLIAKPERANEPRVAAALLAHFLKDKERIVKEALLHDDLRAARRAVNGGSHGLDRFAQAYRIGERLLG